MSGVWASWCRVACGVVLIVAGSGCPLALPEASFACSEQSPDCPSFSVCAIDVDGDGVCRPRGSVDDGCVSDDPSLDGVIRLHADGSTCIDGTSDLAACIAGVCTPVACGDDRKGAQCGDGCHDALEACDDGNTRHDDGCAADCARVETGFVCSAGETGGDACLAVCGDSMTVGSEDCDDGNNDNPVDGCHRCHATKLVSRLVVSGNVDGVVGTDFELRGPIGISAGPDGALYVADARGFRILRHEPVSDEAAALGVADTVVVAGGVVGPPDFRLLDTGGSDQRLVQAVDARLCLPVSVAVDPFGSLYIADFLGHRVLHVDVDGTIATIAGSTTVWDSCAVKHGSREVPLADATLAHAEEGKLDRPISIAVDPHTGDVYVLESGNRRVRRLRQLHDDDERRRRHPRRWMMETVVGQACPLSDRTCGSSSADEPVRPIDVRFGGSGSLGPTSLTLAPNGDLWIADPLPVGRGRLVHVRAECLQDPTAAPPPGVERCVSFERLPGILPTVPFVVHAMQDGTILATDVASRSVLAVSERNARVPPDMAVHPELHRVFAPLERPLGVTSIGDTIFLADANDDRLFQLSPGDTQLTQIMGTAGVVVPGGGGGEGASSANDRAARLERPGQLALDDDGTLFVIDSTGLSLRAFSSETIDGDIEQTPADVQGDVVLGSGRIDIDVLLGLDVRSNRPLNGACISTTPEEFSFAQDDFSVGPEGVAVVAGPDNDRLIFVADSKSRQILRLRNDELCDVTAALYTTDKNQPDYEPGFLRAVRTGGTYDLYVAEMWNPGGNSADRNPCKAGSQGCRLVRLTLDAQGKNGLSTVIPLGTEVGSIRDLLPISSDQILLADGKNHRLWMVDPSGALQSDAFADDPGGVLSLNEPVGLALCQDPRGDRVVVADLTSENRAQLIAVPLDGSPWSVIVPLNGGRLPHGDLGLAKQAGLRAVEGQETSVGLACAPDGTIFVAERTTDLAKVGMGRVRRISPDGIITHFVGSTAPLGPSDEARRARLYDNAHFASRAPPDVAPVGRRDAAGAFFDPTAVSPLAIVDGNLDEESGRVVALGGGDDGPAWLRVAAGYLRPASNASQRAALTAQLNEARGAAWSLDGSHLLVTHSDGAAIRVYETTGIDLDGWLDDGEVIFEDVTLTSIAADPTHPGEFVVVDEKNRCIRRLIGETATALVLNACDAVPETLPNFRPSHVAVSPGGVVYVAESERGRVVRLQEDPPFFEVVHAVDGVAVDAATDSASPRLEQPSEMAFDAWGNLAIALSRRVIVIPDRTGDREPDLDGQAPSLPAFGHIRERYPERSAFCVDSLTGFPSGLQAPKSPPGRVSVPLFVAGDSCIRAAFAISTEYDDEGGPEDVIDAASSGRRP